MANANVEVIVYQDPYYHYWHRPHDYGWFYDDMTPEAQMGRYRGGGQIVKSDTLKTDANGKATLTFDSQRGGQDFEYRIEARVTDAPAHLDRCWLTPEQKRRLRDVEGRIGLEAPRGH